VEERRIILAKAKRGIKNKGGLVSTKTKNATIPNSQDATWTKHHPTADGARLRMEPGIQA
jgi:hypothetical protein